jgi:hypothetical protein
MFCRPFRACSPSAHRFQGFPPLAILSCPHPPAVGTRGGRWLIAARSGHVRSLGAGKHLNRSALVLARPAASRPPVAIPRSPRAGGWTERSARGVGQPADWAAEPRPQSVRPLDASSDGSRRPTGAQVVPAPAGTVHDQSDGVQPVGCLGYRARAGGAGTRAVGGGAGAKGFSPSAAVVARHAGITSAPARTVPRPPPPPTDCPASPPPSGSRRSDRDAPPPSAR